MAKKFRKKIIAGNWKMNKTSAEAQDLATGIKRELADCREVDVVLCPPFTALRAVSDVITDTVIKLGAQNMHWEPAGAYTGEISAAMLRDVFCHYVILGHSERRTFFHETDEIVNRKVKAALSGNLIPIVCVGETIEQREAGQARSVVREQVEKCLADLGQALKSVIIAYEPVWAIGTGRTATPEQAQEMHHFIRQVLTEMADADIASSIRIQYGGSLKPSNATELFSQPDIDGGLVGGASLEVRSFVEIVRAAL
ncbi:MAG: triose-phosphate isomerase [Kiritimatiellae bacterium]|nr:triose-phosphate isomerase [Kiritimatiellia bacterium]